MKIAAKILMLLKKDIASIRENLREFSREVECFALLPGVQWAYRKNILFRILKIKQIDLPHSYWIAFPFYVWIPRAGILIRYLTWEKRNAAIIPEFLESAILLHYFIVEIYKGTRRMLRKRVA